MEPASRIDAVDLPDPPLLDVTVMVIWPGRLGRCSSSSDADGGYSLLAAGAAAGRSADGRQRRTVPGGTAGDADRRRDGGRDEGRRAPATTGSAATGSRRRQPPARHRRRARPRAGRPGCRLGRRFAAERAVDRRRVLVREGDLRREHSPHDVEHGATAAIDRQPVVAQSCGVDVLGGRGLADELGEASGAGGVGRRRRTRGRRRSPWPRRRGRSGRARRRRARPPSESENTRIRECWSSRPPESAAHIAATPGWRSWTTHATPDEASRSCSGARRRR